MNNKQKEAFITKLRGMEVDELNRVIAALDKFVTADLGPQEIFPEGIIVKDSARARFILPPEKHKELMDIINANPQNPIFKDLVVFPLGIIKPDLYETKIQLGGTL